MIFSFFLIFIRIDRKTESKINPTSKIENQGEAAKALKPVSPSTAGLKNSEAVMPTDTTTVIKPEIMFSTCSCSDQSVRPIYIQRA